MTDDILFRLPEQEAELQALAASYATVDFFQSYPDIIQERYGLDLFAHHVYQQVFTEAESKGNIFCSNDSYGSRLFVDTYAHMYQTYAVDVKKNPNIIDDPDVLHLCQLPAHEAVEEIYPQLLEAYTLAKSESPNIFFSPTPNFGPNVCSMPGCTSEDVQMVATLERTISNRPIILRVLSCGQHYDQVKELVKDEQFLFRFIRETLLYEGLQEEEIGSIVTAMKREHKRGKVTDPLIEKFRMRQRLDDPYFLKEAEERLGKNITQFIWAYNDSFVDTAKKYRMTPEAVAIAQALPQLSYKEALDAILQAGMISVWIEFIEPVQSPRGKIWGFSYTLEDKQHVDYAQRIAPVSRAKYQLFLDGFIPKPPLYKAGLDALANDGDARWTTSMHLLKEEKKDESASWRVVQNLLQTWSGCMSGQCGQGKPMCEQCKKVDAWFLSLYMNCLRVLSGEFSEDEKRDPDQTKALFPVKKMTVRRKMPKAETGQLWKFKEVDVVHQFSLVSFDVLKRKAKPEPKEHIPRGSWMEKVDPSAFLHIRKAIAKTERKLTDSRYHKYIEEHGTNIVKVKAHYRWVPTLLKNLNKIYLAEASYSPFFEEDNPPSSC